jgi:hypothetical protein
MPWFMAGTTRLELATSAVSAEHLDDYLNEFTFRFNRRTSVSRNKLFYRLAQQAVHIEPVPFAKLVKRRRCWQQFPCYLSMSFTNDIVVFKIIPYLPG